MKRWKWCFPPLVAAGLLVLAWTGTYQAQDPKWDFKKHDGKALRDSLRDVINHGAEIFNKNGDHAGCYRMFQGALLSVKPFLVPELQKEIDDSIREADKLPRFSDRAFALRKTLDDIRAHPTVIQPPPLDKKAIDKGPPLDKKPLDKKFDDKKVDDKGPPKDKLPPFIDKAPPQDKVPPVKDKAPPQDKKPTDKGATKKDMVKDAPKDLSKDAPKDAPKDAAKDVSKEGKKALWDRLGGERNVRKVVDDFIKTAGPDPKVNMSRNGKYKLDEEAVKHLETGLVRFISAVTGGPFKYDGKNMKESHKGMNITNAEYDAAAKHLKAALEKNKVKGPEAAEVMKAVESLRKDIVEEKKKPAPKTDVSPKDAPSKDQPKKVDDNKKDDLKKAEPKKAEPKKDLPGSSIKSGQETAQISGKVTLDGQPSPKGYFTLVSEDNRRYSTAIQEGSYKFKTPIPVGRYRVAIENPFGEKALQPGIPQRYQSEQTSQLILEVRPGNQAQDIDLKK